MPKPQAVKRGPVEAAIELAICRLVELEELERLVGFHSLLSASSRRALLLDSIQQACAPFKDDRDSGLASLKRKTENWRILAIDTLETYAKRQGGVRA